MLLETLLPLAKKVPPIKVKVDGLQHVFYALGLLVDARSWVSFSLLTTLLLFIPFFYFNSLLSLLALFIGAFIYTLPYLELSSLKKEIEAEMPLFLRQMGSLLKMGIPFLTALKVVSKEGNLAKHMGFVIKEIERGVSIPKALLDFAEKLGTTTTKRAIAQIISVYEHGGGDELKRLGDELLNGQRHTIKQYAAKSSLMALLFIVLAVVGPTFFIVAQVVGNALNASQAGSFNGNASASSALNVANKALFIQSIFVLDIAIPLFAFLLVIVGISLFPSVIFASKSLSLLTLYVAIPLAALFFLPIPQLWRFVIIGLAFLLSATKFVKEYRKRKRVDELEAKLGDALLVASTLPKGVHMKELFERLCKEKLGYISKEFCIAKRQFDNNMNITNVMDDLKKRVPSKLFERVIEILDYAFKSGKNVGEKISEIAEDILMFSELKREQISMISIQKYSLLMGMLLVPLIVSSAFSIISSLGVTKGVSLQGIEESVVPAYLIIMSAVTAIFITSLEGKRTEELIYFFVLVFLTLFIYFNLRISPAMI